MGVEKVDPIVKTFDDWYIDRREDSDGCLDFRSLSPFADQYWRKWEDYKREMDARVANYDKLVMVADAEVATKKPDLPNVSSGETAGMIRRMARNLVQHTPNVDVICKFDDDSVPGIFVRHILKTKIIGDDLYSNDMQQNLFASAKNSLTLGYDTALPALLQDAAGSWYMKYDNIFYRDVFPEPGARDIRQATDVFVRRYLTKGEVRGLAKSQANGWDVAALKALLKTQPSNKQMESVDRQTKKHHSIPEGYEVITYYSNTGDPFLTFDAKTKLLLRVEKNKHPLKQHPVFFLIMEKDLNQPLGKSQVELVYGRQEFQDLLFNGAMKLWYRNVNPPLIGYGVVNGAINMSPGKYNPISNPNARVEPFEVNTQTLLQYGQISQLNAGNMVQLVGAADQQMATQGTGGQMSQTPQGVEAQAAMVDITTNNYQKAIESFFSQYLSYALTTYFQELKGVKKVTPTADARQAMIGAGIDPKEFNEKGELEIDFEDLATEYWVRVVPGSLVEMEDEKQLRILNQLFVPLSQAMPALAASGDQQALANATAAMQFIITKQLELSGSAHSTDLKQLMESGVTAEQQQRMTDIGTLETKISEITTGVSGQLDKVAAENAQLKEQVGLLIEGQGAMMQRLGVSTEPTGVQEAAVPM